jgi:hypothetical protein
VIAGDKCDKNQVLAVGCNPYDGECEGMGTIVTVGVKHIKFWSMSEGGLRGQKVRKEYQILPFILPQIAPDSYPDVTILALP